MIRRPPGSTQSSSSAASDVYKRQHKGDAQRALKDYNGSLLSYSQALQLNSSKKAAWSGKIEAYAALQDYASASAFAAKLSELYPKDKANWYKEGQLLQLQGRFEEAIPKFDSAINLDPKYKDALYRKALSLLASNDTTTQAIELLDQVVLQDPNYKAAYNAKGHALEFQGKYSEALASYERALQIDPKYNQALINKMHALLALGRQREAIDIFQKI